MDDFFDDCDGMKEAWDDKPEFEEEPAESDNRFWDVPGERDWPLIIGISGDIAREKRGRERVRREWECDDDDDYWDMINRRW